MLRSNPRSRLLTLFGFALALLTLLSLAVPAVATEGEAPAAETEEPAEEPAEETATDYQPAVTVAEEAAEEIVQPWTNRFLIPTMALLAVALLFVTVLQYFLKVVKARYKVVE